MSPRAETEEQRQRDCHGDKISDAITSYAALTAPLNRFPIGNKQYAARALSHCRSENAMSPRLAFSSGSYRHAQPDRLLDDLRRKPVPVVADLHHPLG
jgi:hypothetical protein